MNTEPTIFGFALNRVVAFLGPYLAVVAGGIATWLVAKLNVLGVPGLDQHNIETGITAALVFGVTALVSWLGQQKWLEGFQRWAYGIGSQVDLPEIELPPEGNEATMTDAELPEPGPTPEGAVQDKPGMTE